MVSLVSTSDLGDVVTSRAEQQIGSDSLCATSRLSLTFDDPPSLLVGIQTISLVSRAV